MRTRVMPVLLVATVMLISRCSFAMAGEAPSVDQVIDDIARHEDVIDNISARIVVTVPEDDLTFLEGEWGYSGGREYLAGTERSIDREASRITSYHFRHAFDGNLMYAYSSQNNRHNGRVGDLDHICFVARTPHTLIGYDLHSSGRRSVAEILRRAEGVSVRAATESVNGRRCFVIEAIGIEDIEGLSVDARLWVDAERDYRPLRIEKYRNELDLPRWTSLWHRADNIELQEIDGVWIPVEGQSQYFHLETAPLPGLTREDYERMTPEEVAQKLDYVLKPYSMWLIRIDPESVSFGKEIPAEEFKIDWPEGTTIWDAQLQQVVAGPSVGIEPLELPAVTGVAGLEDGEGAAEDEGAQHVEERSDGEPQPLSPTEEDRPPPRAGRGGLWVVVAAMCCLAAGILAWKLRRPVAAARQEKRSDDT